MARKTTTERGYGWEHQKLRAQWEPKVRAGLVRCARCDEPIAPDADWDLGHTDDRTAYTGPECVNCNRSAGGKNGAKAVHDKRAMTIRDW